MRAGFMTMAVAVAMSSSVAVAQEGGAKAAIAAVNKEFVAAVAKGDAARVASAYTMDAQVLPPGQDVVSGRDAIEKFWESVIASGMAGLTLTTSELVAHQDMAHEVSTFVVSGKDGAPMERGKYIVIWKRDGGAWKLHRDIWNSSSPPAPAAAAPRQ